MITHILKDFCFYVTWEKLKIKGFFPGPADYANIYHVAVTHTHKRTHLILNTAGGVGGGGGGGVHETYHLFQFLVGSIVLLLQLNAFDGQGLLQFLHLLHSVTDLLQAHIQVKLLLLQV